MKSCPFCGSEKLRVKPCYQVECLSCRAEGPLASSPGLAEVDWDKRTADVAEES